MSHNEKRRLFGIDYGAKRVGLAVSDPTRKFAIPVTVIHNTDLLIPEIEKLAKEYDDVKEIVMGESRNYKNEANEILFESMDFKDMLEKKGFTVHLELEFMTSIQAERLQGKNEMSDASAAALILQSFLDREKMEKE